MGAACAAEKYYISPFPKDFNLNERRRKMRFVRVLRRRGCPPISFKCVHAKNVKTRFCFVVLFLERGHNAP